MPSEPSATAAVAEALDALGIERLVLGVHESAFPAAAPDCGHGSPHAAGAPLLEFVRGLGFDTLQLGPGGQITDGNPSPYDGSVFARNVLRLDVLALTRADGGALLRADEIERAVAATPARGDVAEPRRARRIVTPLLELAHDRFRQLRADHAAVRAFRTFRAEARDWVELDAIYEVLAARTRCDDPARLDPAIRSLFEPGPAAAERRRLVAMNLEEPIEAAVFAQWLLDHQARALRAAAHARGLRVLGDLQIGWSVRDRFLRPQLFARGWLMGAPPSRTNPKGQPWGYALLDPDQLDDADSPARAAFLLQLRWLLRGHDGLRIDHPHGLVCPWIYAAGQPDPAAAVRAGTRAFESPDRDDAALRRWAIARVEDLDPAVERHADAWVRRLDGAQVARYARLFDVVVRTVHEHGGGDLAAEVLSTCPMPLRAVLDRAGLGRFVVTQKANPADPGDVYRTDRAGRQDWVMLGNHDTPPIFALAERWLREGRAAARAAWLAERLEPDVRARAAAAARFCASPSALCHAMLADLFLGPAGRVFVYWTDLFGASQPFNRAGIVHRDNWRQRLPCDYRAAYEARRAAGCALDLRAALALALHARGARPDLGHMLAQQVERPDRTALPR
ncbi:MAG TPA: 4-alpha-glucanotransferase [Planctomycetota bacterium]|nr:4-alpha-glucanotransferase [Planctomycetota bacterium]